MCVESSEDAVLTGGGYTTDVRACPIRLSELIEVWRPIVKWYNGADDERFRRERSRTVPARHTAFDDGAAAQSGGG